MHIEPCIVFVIEKPSFARLFAPLAAKYWPSQQIYTVCTFGITGLYEFRYPRGLKLDDYPRISEPSWKPRHIKQPVSRLVDGTVVRTDLEPAIVLGSAETIYFASDPDHSGAIAYQVLLTQTLGPEAAQQERPALLLNSWMPSDIEKALSSPVSTADFRFRQWLNAGTACRHFDFNYNVNALALFGASLRQAGVNLPEYGISKCSLQLLYGLQEQSAMHVSAVFALMERWPGTGRYAPAELGSVASRSAIVSGLLDAGLLLKRNDACLAVSERGDRFLELLHPDCRDIDLPARLVEWANTWPASQGKMERYLRTFFGKQKRFGAA
ncbi:hypothetical protein [Chromobacterium haemolyticum]|uniref:hypothetical protein n=1 Tax=Chromobacterium haemolyticum TaxID=394935 RepID=UPI002448844C|nr:hypothetical protein [Chromobacterium haemolyticum]MDH0342158.1 hypothetical protein [Chromobacterium haemolyticum]